MKEAIFKARLMAQWMTGLAVLSAVGGLALFLLVVGADSVLGAAALTNGIVLGLISYSLAVGLRLLAAMAENKETPPPTQTGEQGNI